MNVFDKAPSVDKEAFVAPSASITGDVHVGRGSSIWYGCVLRGKCHLREKALFGSDVSLVFNDVLWFSAGDANSISIGAGTNIQDNSLVHVAKSNLSGKVLPAVIGDNVTIGKFLAFSA